MNVCHNVHSLYCDIRIDVKVTVDTLSKDYFNFVYRRCTQGSCNRKCKTLPSAENDEKVKATQSE